MSDRPIRVTRSTVDAMRTQQSRVSSSPKTTVPKLKFRLRKPTLPIYHPDHVLPQKKYNTFREWFEQEGVTEETISPESAYTEYQIRERLRQAARPGNVLSTEQCSAYLTQQSEDTLRLYSHQDHLVAHALYFKKLLDKERKAHRHLAKMLAHACAEEWRKRNQRPEDLMRLEEEQMRQSHKQLVRDLQRMFDAVRVEVNQMKLLHLEETKKEEDQLALDKAIRKSTMLFERRKSDRAKNLGSDDANAAESLPDNGVPDRDASASTGDSDMSSTSRSESDHESGDDDDETLTAEELRRKYSNMGPDNLNELTPSSMAPSTHRAMEKQADYTSDMDIDSIDLKPHATELEEVDPMLLDDTDETSQSDNENDNEDDDDDESGSEASQETSAEDTEGDEEDGETSDGETGLLGFYSSGDVTKFQDPEAELASTNQDFVDGHVSEPFAAEDHVVGEYEKPEENSQGEPHDYRLLSDASRQQSVLEDQGNSVIHSPVNSTEDVNKMEDDAQHEENAPLDVKTPVPHLIRGALREYQHYGLDWLAGLYNSHINGILADEMGLGKTIQAIALIAHLAVQHHVWGPHLVVVPTSVMLNWEMEFKKWAPGFKILTYYGSQEERRQKRKGWMDDDRWNVCITSYQLVLQDQQTFKRRNWHYMILDEAHNIKNFRSQRWQTLLTFKTHARLLLTGTPLQNNLTELWSLLFFLMPSDDPGHGLEGFADLRNFSEWFRRPVEQILENGRETMDDESRKVVTKLHTVLRPYILRRLKNDVEKQMPAKYEHVVPCKLSKRQRYLYDGFMSRAQTKETLASGNYLSIVNCLMQLRKVCNHPDLFETRPITTSFAMEKSAIAHYESMEHLIRRRLLAPDVANEMNLAFMNLILVKNEENLSKILVNDTLKFTAQNAFRLLRERQHKRTNYGMRFDGSTAKSALTSLENISREMRVAELDKCIYIDAKKHDRRPIYWGSLIDFLTVDTDLGSLLAQRNRKRLELLDWLSNRSSVLASMILSLNDRAVKMEPVIERFAFVTPAVVADDVTEAALVPIRTTHLKESQVFPEHDPFHLPQTKLSIAFPDKRLLQYDCGKLQQLDLLLRKLEAGGHRALIFTQMTKMLDILEQFLNIHGHRYLRLDGATKVEQRQVLMDRFNNDTRILAFILSSRSGGLGINLTGADTVIFYDLDWNPAMDKQCQDRCHRIGQTRDVHIYRLVSEYTIESNILRKANQKRMLDDVVIQEGEFTTNYMDKMDVDMRKMLDESGLDEQDEAGAAMDRVLNTEAITGPRVLEQAEDREDIAAAKNAEKELENVDGADFEEGASVNAPRASSTTTAATTPVATHPHPPAPEEEKEPEFGHIDDYLIRLIGWDMKDVPAVVPPDKKKSRRDRDQRVRRRR